VNTGRVIKKIAFIAIWLVIGAGMITLLAAAMRKQNNDRCRDYSIDIKGSKENLFLDRNEVEQLLMNATDGKIKGQELSAFNLHQLEQTLAGNNWVDEADLYFDNRNVLHINITERSPVARVFTRTGKSFYIDSKGGQMPLSPRLSARVPVFTGFPDRKLLNANDSLLVKQVSDMASFILNDPFWMAQVSQIDISPERNFEMVPVVGNHLVRLGDGANAKQKFRRLFIFYQQVLSKTGFEKYKTIDVQFSGQVVASRQTANQKIDSIQLIKNVEKLLQQSRELKNDTLPPATAALNEKPLIETMKTDSKLRDPNPVNSVSVPPVENKTEPKPAGDPRVPKAVMVKRNQR
jgi:cell division protein FtsQ